MTDLGPTDLVPLAEATPAPVYGAKMMRQSFVDYRELQTVLDEQMPDAIIELDGKKFRKKSYWRAVAVAFNLQVDLVKEERIARGEDWGYTVSYRARAANGRSADGDGACMASEKNRGRMRATEHNVRSHAHTRAYNRAVSNLVGFGEVSAEEVEEAPHAEEPAFVLEATPTKPAPDAHKLVKVAKVEIKSKGEGANGPWTLYSVTFDDGLSAGTLKDDVATRAEEYRETSFACIRKIVKSKRNPKYWDLIGLEPPPDGTAPF